MFFWRPEALLIKTMNHDREDVVLFFCQPHTRSSVISHPSLGHRTQALKTPLKTLVALWQLCAGFGNSPVHSFLSKLSPHSPAQPL